MKRLIAVVLMLAIQSASTIAFNWASTAEEVAASTVKITFQVEDPLTNQVGEAVCSGFSVDDRRQLFMTANHCVGSNMKVDGHLAWLVYENLEDDLAVVQVIGVQKPALKPAKRAARTGNEILAVGWAFGIIPSYRSGTVQAINIDLSDVELGKNWVIAGFGYISGMSGGPVVNTEGRVISIVQRGSESVGLGKDLPTILKHTHQFWRYTP